MSHLGKTDSKGSLLAAYSNEDAIHKPINKCKGMWQKRGSKAKRRGKGLIAGKWTSLTWRQPL